MTAHKQRGGFVLGVVAGLLVGLALALGVALYITKAPVPFVNKVPQRTAEQDQAEQARNKNWDPNAPLAGGKPAKAASGAAGSGTAAAEAPASAAALAASGAPAKVGAAASAPGATKPARDPAAILAGSVTPGGPAPAAAPAAPTGGGPAPGIAPAKPGVDPFLYFVQAGAYARQDEAEQQRAKLAMLGLAAKITEREQNGRVVYRVRVGPFEGRGDADALQSRLQESTIESQIVRVERP